jgi:modulator of FtsH protease
MLAKMYCIKLKMRFGTLLKNKSRFLISTYTLLVAQLAITFGIVYAFRNNPRVATITRQSLFLYLFLTLGLVLILSFVPMPNWLKLVLFTTFAVIFGGLLHSMSIIIPKEHVDNAFKSTIAVFIAMSIFGVILAYFGFDLSWLMLLLIAGLIGLIVAGLLILPLVKSSPLLKTFYVISIVLFSCFVVVYTNMIIQPSYKGTYIDAAISFYLDFVNIFTASMGVETI